MVRICSKVFVKLCIVNNQFCRKYIRKLFDKFCCILNLIFRWMNYRIYHQLLYLDHIILLIIVDNLHRLQCYNQIFHLLQYK